MTNLIDVNAVAAKLNRHKATVYRMVVNGVIPRPIKRNARVARWDSKKIDDLSLLLRSRKLRGLGDLRPVSKKKSRGAA